MTGITRITVACIAMGMALPVAAASLRFETPQPAYQPGTDVVVSVLLNTEEESANAVEAVLRVEGGVIADVSEGNSVISLWMQPPRIHGNERVEFAGIFPGGRTGSALVLLSITVRPNGEEAITVHAEQVTVLKNDEKGTDLPSATTPLTIVFSEDAAVAQLPTTKKDVDPPDLFTPVIAQDPLLFGGKKTLIFHANDAQSGIHHYEIFETPRVITRESDIHWARAESPYVLRDQEQKSVIYVKAIDRAGNERIVRVDPLHTPLWHEEKEMQDLIVWAIGFVCILGYIIFQRSWNKRGNVLYSNGSLR